MVVTPGQRADSTQFKPVLEKIRVPKPGPGRHRKKPDSIAADKAYSNGPCREYLRGGASGTQSQKRPTARMPAFAKAHPGDGCGRGGCCPPRTTLALSTPIGVCNERWATIARGSRPRDGDEGVRRVSTTGEGGHAGGRRSL
ncbi:transposase [Streptomyces sp. NPDC048362]|uniref:transposase n=1 Tax=Streptomyces sp. NPDC048362 TaxID=3365539 RepID=UPI0037138C63